MTSVGSRLTNVGCYTVTLVAGDAHLDSNFGVVEDDTGSQVEDTGANQGTLPFTGSTALQVALVAGLLVLAGTGGVFVLRRRPQ